MLTILSPSKSVTDAPAPFKIKETKPLFADKTKKLVKALVPKTKKELMDTLELSESLAELNYDRYQNWSSPTQKRSAIWIFAGDVYNGLDAYGMSKETLEYAQDNLRILSGLYGLIRPLDTIQPYRLEMKLKVSGEWGKNLYDFWGDMIAKEIVSSGESLLLNCASKEYSTVLLPHLPETIDVITPRFMQKTTDGLKEKALFAKYARGAMARWVMDTQVDTARELEAYCLDGFLYSPELSKTGSPVFIVPAGFSLAGRFTKN